MYPFLFWEFLFMQHYTAIFNADSLEREMQFWHCFGSPKMSKFWWNTRRIEKSFLFRHYYGSCRLRTKINTISHYFRYIWAKILLFCLDWSKKSEKKKRKKKVLCFLEKSRKEINVTLGIATPAPSKKREKKNLRERMKN